MAEAFNEYFCNIYISVNSNNSQTISCLNSSYPIRFPSQTNSFFLRQCSSEDIITAAMSLKKGSNKCYPFSNTLLKKLCILYPDCFASLINLIFKHCTFPPLIKLSFVIPLFKSGNRSNISNYRPIALINPISKLVEKIIFDMMLGFLDKSNILSNDQFGFRKKRSCDLSLLQIIPNIYSISGKKQYLLCVFLDLRKAFDSVSHHLLIDKLFSYGFRGNILRLLNNYLLSRYQSVIINGKNSTSKPVTAGVPQGSILGPLLFLLYINDLPLVSSIIKFLLYADDTALYIIGSNLQDIINIMNTELVKITRWLEANGLSLNIEKCKCLLFGPKTTTAILSPLIRINNKSIECVQNYKFLGLRIDKSLNWADHIDDVINRVSSRVYYLFKAKLYLGYSDKFVLYNSLIHSLFSRYICFWGVNLKMREKLFLLQKRCLRIIHNKPFLFHTAPLFKDSSILKIEDIYKYELTIIIFKIVNNFLPTLDISLLSPYKSNVREFRLSTSIIKPFFCTSSFGQKSPYYSGLKLYNNLPLSIRNITSLPLFKAKLKLYLIDKY